MTFRSSAATIALVAATALGTSAAQAEEVSLRAVTAFATGTTFSRDFEAFVDWVNENGKGVVQIELLQLADCPPNLSKVGKQNKC